jgi:hypothetical protein
MDYAALKFEITNDPNGYGYATPYAAGEDSAVSAILNEVRAAIDIDRGLVESYEIVNCIVPSEWAALSAAEKDRIAFIVSAGRIDTRATNVRNAFTTAFGAGTSTRANITAILTRNGSRAEQLFGGPVVHEDIAKARLA